LSAQEEDAHVHHVMGEVRRNPRRKFAKGPRMRWGEKADACRIYGSLEGNKVQGDFHITARGHGYRELGEHLSHEGESFLPSFILWIVQLLAIAIGWMVFQIPRSTSIQPST
jgi:hypothetical protein